MHSFNNIAQMLVLTACTLLPDYNHKAGDQTKQYTTTIHTTTSNSPVGYAFQHSNKCVTTTRHGAKYSEHLNFTLQKGLQSILLHQKNAYAGV